MLTEVIAAISSITCEYVESLHLGDREHRSGSLVREQKTAVKCVTSFGKILKVR